MKVGKTVKVHTSPQRKIEKVGQKTERPIPVYIPEKEKVPAQAKWKMEYRMYWGLDVATGKDRTVYASGVS